MLAYFSDSKDSTIVAKFCTPTKPVAIAMFLQRIAVLVAFPMIIDKLIRIQNRFDEFKTATASVVANQTNCGEPTLVLSTTFIDEGTKTIDEALFSSMFLAFIAVGSVIVELIVTIVLYFVCRSCFAEKVKELDLGVSEVNIPQEKDK
jgi:hypothetical protein